ncbi:GNAT family N-acetyltransferase [Bacillus spongiae]|uniref:GNAT family N-acetyltransferase n=1 Tax=Bacillus spongiae TaxID=2683610 RepID=A0ABU8HDM5_9BACI
MQNIEIRRPRSEDSIELNQFFSTVIKDTFAKEGLSEMHDFIENEIENKKQYLKCDLDSNGENRYFLIAIDKNSHKIIGTIACGPASELIISCTGRALKELYEVGTIFIHPDYQKRGIGTLLINELFLTFQNRDIKEFCLDSGYKNAQKVWMKKFGKPDYLLKDYWGEGRDHMIWKKSTHDMAINLRNDNR